MDHSRDSSTHHAAAREEYTIPDNYTNLDELAVSTPVDDSRQDNGEPDPLARSRSHEQEEEDKAARESGSDTGNFAALDELGAPSPVRHRHERRSSLEEVRSQEQEYRRLSKSLSRSKTRDSHLAPVTEQPLREASDTPTSSQPSDQEKAIPPPRQRRRERVSKFATELYIHSYLILFSILGTLARLGLQTLTFYPSAPISTSVIWANFGGSLFMGFLSEDRKLFREEWGRKEKAEEDAKTDATEDEARLAAARKAHAAVMKTIPLFIGLTTGFCGSFTSFSSYIRDVFLSMSNDLPTPISHPYPASVPVPSYTTTVSRNGGYSFLALLASFILTPAICLSALQCGAHLAIFFEPLTPSLPFFFTRKIFDRLAVILGLGAWLTAVILAAVPPDRPGGTTGVSSWSQETWRGEVLFSLVFAPLGALGRFYASLHLNARIASFPLGTFLVNVVGTAILGMCFSIQHAGSTTLGTLGQNLVGCQVLEGIVDGFCGCLTTVSTWVLELRGLKRKHAYVYGVCSVVVAWALLVVEIGSLRWTQGFESPVCRILRS